MANISVLFVCLGNICRSPLAEAIFREKVKEAGLNERFHIDSCGTAAFHIGEQPDSRSVANAASNGVHYSHKARQLVRSDFTDFDYILPMDASNFRNTLELAPADHKANVKLMRDFDEAGTGQDVPDPYYGGAQGFQEVFDILDRSTEALLKRIREEKNL